MPVVARGAGPIGRKPGPGIWWVLAALAATVAVLGFVMSLPVEVVGGLLVVASLAVLAAGLTTRSRRIARWRSFDNPPRGGCWPRPPAASRRLW